MEFCRPLGPCVSNLTAVAPPLAAPAPVKSSTLATFRPGIPVLFLALTITFLLTFVLLLYAKHCKRGGDGPGNLSFYGGAVATTPGRNSGMTRAVVESLPAFRFSALQGRRQEGLECAVCLARFEPAEILRLLPKCQHAFHLECVDTWLDAHSTCPLCRSRVDPEDVLLLPDVDKPRQSKRGADELDGPPPGRRISGRHSSAGEKYSLPAVVCRSDTSDRRCRMSVDSAAATRAAAARPAVGCFDRVRKDTHLLAVGESVEQRCGHRIIVAAGGGDAPERWSDLMPSDLMLLRSEMIIVGDGADSLRCVSEIVSLSRDGGARKSTVRRWLGFAAKRTAGWGRDNVPSGD